MRSQILRSTSTNSPAPPSFYRAISQNLSSSFVAGTFLKDGPRDPDAPAASSMPNPLTDPGAMEGMMDGMKKQMVMMVPQMLIMGWISFFFEGFVLSEFVLEHWPLSEAKADVVSVIVKLPFPLTLGFKSMLQRGIETPDMDARWVSSLSWYFLNLFGLNGLFRILLGSENGEFCMPFPARSEKSDESTAADSSRDMAQNQFAMPTGQPQDYNKLFLAEKDNLELAEGLYTWVGADVERRVLEKYGKLQPLKLT